MIAGQHCHLFRIVHGWLVSTRKHKVLVKIAHGRSDLLPVCFLFSINRILHILVDVLVQPTAIPMYVQQNIYVIVHTIPNHFLHSIKPVLIDMGGCLVVYMMPIPGTWNADSIKATLLNKFYEVFRNHRASPSCFTTRSFKSVADVPAELHFRSEFDSGSAHPGCVGGFG